MTPNEKVWALLRLNVLNRTTGTFSVSPDDQEILEFGFTPKIESIADLDALYSEHSVAAEAFNDSGNHRAEQLDSLVQKIAGSIDLTAEEADLLRTALR